MPSGNPGLAKLRSLEFQQIVLKPDNCLGTFQRGWCWKNRNL
jgi:hypothetical protein